MAQDMSEKEIRQMELDQLKKEVKLERQMVMGFKCTLLKEISTSASTTFQKCWSTYDSFALCGLKRL